MNELLWVVAAVGKRWLLSGWSHVWASQVIEIIAICLDARSRSKIAKFFRILANCARLKKCAM
jgi:hypothetical protein